MAFSTTLLEGSNSTNANNGSVVLTADFEGKASGWSLLEVGGAKGAVKIEPSDSARTNVLQLTVASVGGRCGVTFAGKAGVDVQTNQWYDFTFRARTEKRENDRGYGLTVSLESRDGKQICARTTIPEVGGDWHDYAVALHSRLANSGGVLIITVSEPGTIWFDDITLKQRQTGAKRELHENP